MGYIDQAAKVSGSNFCRKNDILQIQIRTVSDHKSPAETGDVFRHFNIKRGLVCYNSDQPQGKTCENYEIRVFCRYRVDDDNKFLSIFDRFKPATSVPGAVLDQATDLCDKFSMCCGDI